MLFARGRDAVVAARSFLAHVSVRDGATDLLGVVLDGAMAEVAERTEDIVRAAQATTGGSVLVVVAGTGSAERSRAARSDRPLVDAVEEAVPGRAPAVAATVPGGVFLDQETLRAAGVTGQAAVDALLEVTGPDGRETMADAFQGFAVSFARYC